MCCSIFQNSIEETIFSDLEDSQFKHYIEVYIKMMACKSEQTEKHCIRVSTISCEIGKAYGLSKTYMKYLFLSSILHDVGKMFIRDEILHKPDKLTQDEYEIMKAHSIKSYEALNKIEKLKNIAPIVLCHHERYDGKGYPNGLKEKEIPFFSRIISVADAFDAMTSPRIYKSSLSIFDATKELEKGRFTQFDGNIVNDFIGLIKKGRIITKCNYFDEERMKIG